MRLFIKEYKPLWIILSLAYFLSLFARYILVYQMQGYPELLWNDEFMILSPDGYLYANTAKESISLSIAPLSLLTAIFAKILPFSFETIIFYMSTFLSSLIVIPIFFIAKRFTGNIGAFVSALFSSLAIGYFNRTTSGYYDTDMLIIVLPMFTYWFLIESSLKQSKLFASLTVLSTLIFSWWLPSNIALNISIAFMLFIYTLVFERKNLFNYFLFILLVIASIPLAIALKFTLLIFGFSLLFFHDKLNKKITFTLLVSSLLLLIIILVIYHETFFNLVSQKLSYYFAKDADFSNGLYFADSGSHVIEVASVDFLNFAHRVSGNLVIFIFSLLSYILLVKRYHIALLFLPMLGFGAMAYGIPGIIPSAGQRFLFYAIPTLSISLIYGILYINMKSKKYLSKKLKLRYILFILIFIPSLLHIFNYKAYIFYQHNDVAVLDKLKSNIKKGDHVISWWDYGYFLQYYSGAKTVSDGGRQLGKILSPISKVFMSQAQDTTALLAKLTSREASKGKGLNYISMMMKTYNYKDVNHFLDDVNKGLIKAKDNKFDTYLYIPRQMISNYSVMDTFDRTDLKKGKLVYQPKYFHLTQYPVAFKKEEEIISFERGLVFYQNKDELYLTKHKIAQRVKRIYTMTVKDGKTKVLITKTRYNVGLSIIILEDKRVIVADDNTMSSAFIQLGLFQNYNPEVFEAVILSPIANVYRIKKD